MDLEVKKDNRVVFVQSVTKLGQKSVNFRLMVLSSSIINVKEIQREVKLLKVIPYCYGVELFFLF